MILGWNARMFAHFVCFSGGLGIYYARSAMLKVVTNFPEHPYKVILELSFPFLDKFLLLKQHLKQNLLIHWMKSTTFSNPDQCEFNWVRCHYIYIYIYIYMAMLTNTTVVLSHNCCLITYIYIYKIKSILQNMIPKKTNIFWINWIFWRSEQKPKIL